MLNERSNGHLQLAALIDENVYRRTIKGGTVSLYEMFKVVLQAQSHCRKDLAIDVA